MNYHGRSKGQGYGRQTKRLQRIHSRRSLTAQKIDESLKAPIPENAEQWLKHPNRYDIPNVDLPKTE